MPHNRAKVVFPAVIIVIALVLFIGFSAIATSAHQSCGDAMTLSQNSVGLFHRLHPIWPTANHSVLRGLITCWFVVVHKQSTDPAPSAVWFIDSFIKFHWLYH